jgi:glutathione S-transferase
MPIDPEADIEITAYEWVPSFAQGFVRDLRPRWACEELGLGYRERLISAVERPEWYFAEQPWGQVPVIRDGEITVFESGATLVHIAEKAGGLLPASGQPRAEALSWLFAAFNSVEPSLMELANVSFFSRKEEWAKLREPSLLEAIGGRLDRLETALGDRDWLAGDFSIADIAMVTVLREVGRTDLFAGRPALEAYVERGTARPAFRTALDAQLAPFPAHAPRQTAGA